jgi:hypothetical protein
MLSAQAFAPAHVSPFELNLVEILRMKAPARHKNRLQSERRGLDARAFFCLYI